MSCTAKPSISHTTEILKCECDLPGQCERAHPEEEVGAKVEVEAEVEVEVEAGAEVEAEAEAEPCVYSRRLAMATEA